MAASKTIDYSAEQNVLANLAKALAHPARIAILQALMKQKECICNDLVMQLPLKQATVSQHLKVLKKAGFIRGTIEPNRSCYCLDGEQWSKAKALLGAFLDAGEMCCTTHSC